MTTEAIRDMQRKQAIWHYNKAGYCMDAAREWRDKAFARGYIPDRCLDLCRDAVARARKHNHLSLRYRRGELTN